MEEMRKACKILVGKPEGNRLFGDLSVDERMLIKWILKN
jgi:hypothetical protein